MVKKRNSPGGGSFDPPKNLFERLYLRYCLVTVIYMLEPYERRFFNTVVFGLLAVSFYYLFGALLATETVADTSSSPAPTVAAPATPAKPDKVTLLLVAVGDAPSLKMKKFNVDAKNDIAYLTGVIRKMLQLPEDKSLFFFINQTFSPSPDHTLGVLRDCYAVTSTDGVADHLPMHYSTTYAWG